MPRRKTFTVEVTLTARVEAASSAEAAADVLSGLPPQSDACTVVVTVVKEVKEES